MLWRAWVLSKQLKITPAEVFSVGDGLEGPYEILGRDLAVYSFNSAVTLFGSTLEREMDGVESNAKDSKAAQREIEAGRTRIFQKWIPRASDAEPTAKPASAFADPALR